ncbi:MAG: TrpR YerC/YecD [Syntrophomonadaceae bacterium]|nr:TrpR YerC/YecD [Syntrophomonadaceae bacterium]
MADDKKLLVSAFLVLANEKECSIFLDDLCTKNELDILSQRLRVASMLVENETYNRIAEITGASTATISRVKRFLNVSGGYQLVWERLRDKGGL